MKDILGILLLMVGSFGAGIIVAGRISNKAVLKLIMRYGGIDGGHHKMWVLDQIVRLLTGDKYKDWVREYCDGEDGPCTYSWDIGIAP